MKVLSAALLIALSAATGSPAFAQEVPSSTDQSALAKVLNTELPPERMELAMKLVELSGISRTFDEVLPTIAEQSKNSFIRANPQMQLGIIAIVDKVAVQLVSRRPELDQYLARIWAAGFTDEEMQELIDFYSTETGKRFSTAMPQLLAVQTIAAEEWGRSIADELNSKVQQELRASVAAEQEALQNDIAGPSEEPAPAPQQ